MKILRRKDEEAVSPVIAIILMVAITVVLASVLYVWVMNLAQTDDSEVAFPTIEVTLSDNGAADRLTIKHVQGDPIDWTGYKVIMTNNTDETTTTMTQLNSLGTQNAGESKQINSTIGGFTGINYEKGKTYTMEIYNLKENKRVFNRDNLVCS